MCGHHWTFCWGFDCFASWLYDWQQMIAGMLALIAAGVSVLYLRKQISQADRHEKERWHRRSEAARALLPHTLNEIAEYAKLLADALKDYYRLAIKPREDHQRLTIKVPAPPPELLATLEKLVEVSDKPIVQEIVADIISEIQVLYARAMGLNEHAANPAGNLPNLYGYMVQAAVIHAQGSSLFPYARHETDQIGRKIDWNDVAVAAGTVGLVAPEFAEDQRLMMTRSQSGRRPEVAGDR